MTRLSFAIAAAILAQPLAVTAQPAAPAPDARPWRVDWGDYECFLIRKPAPGRPFATDFITLPSGVHMKLRLVMNAGVPTIEGVDNVVLMPGGRAFPVTTDRSAPVQRPGVRNHYGLPPEFRQLLAEATELQLRAGAQIRARVPLDGVRVALAAHQQCLSDVAREWGLDEAALAALSRRPNSTNNVGLDIQDYPATALQRNAQGRVAMRITVTPAGRAADCVVVASSGRPDFDAAACQGALRRGRFEPGLDAAGRPVAVRDLFVAGFFLPDG